MAPLFVQILLELGLDWGEQQTLEVFECYDTNNKGYLHYGDFRRILRRDAQGVGTSSFDKRDREKAPVRYFQVTLRAQSRICH